MTGFLSVAGSKNSPQFIRPRGTRAQIHTLCGETVRPMSVPHMLKLRPHWLRTLHTGTSVCSLTSVRPRALHSDPSFSQ